MAQKYAALGKALVPPDGVNVAGATTPAALQALAARHRDSYAVQVAVGQALATSGARDSAMAAYERAHALVPSATGQGSPRAQMADLAERAGDFARASRELRGLIADDHTNIAAARRLVPLARRLGQEDALVQALDLIITIDPFDSAAHTERGRLAMAKRDTGLATREFRAALASGPVDVAPAHCDLAEALLLGGDRVESRREVLAALEIAPSYERAQELLLRIVDGK
jgi:tetratricopeptide (TPR) repeat protein